MHIVWMTGVKRGRAPRYFIWLPPASKGIPSFLFDLGILRTCCECEADVCVSACAQSDRPSPSLFNTIRGRVALRVE